ncbi:MAG: hypothetical protein Fur0020_13790 [Thermodesulfovibrionia bacterium]
MEDKVINIITYLLIFLVLSLIGYSLTRLYLLRQRRIIRERKVRGEGTEVGFVVDTFHELVARLKEKERELALLKSQAEERAGRIEAYNENILQSIPSGVITIDNEMIVRSINRSAEQILGIKADEVLGKGFRDVFGESLVSILEEGDAVRRSESTYTTPDERRIWLGVTTSQLRNKGGEVIGRLFIFTDLTDIKALQEEMKLKERLSQLGEMSAGIAHELRNSMSVISGYAKILSRNVDGDNIGPIRAMLNEIKNMDTIISELLSFARPTVVSKSLIDLNRLIEEAVSVVKDRDSIVVSINKGDGALIEADEALIRQAITNLLINAVESMPDGGRLDIDVMPKDDAVIIEIRDTGCGIPDDIKDKIFLPFFTTKERGIGVGLALVQKIVISHNGRIEFESEEGRGSTFRISLPRG